MPSDLPRLGSGRTSHYRHTRRDLLAGASVLLTAPGAPALGRRGEDTTPPDLPCIEAELLRHGPTRGDRSALELFRAWDALFAGINDASTPETDARDLLPELATLREAIEAEPAGTLAELAAQVLALTGHGEFELPESLVEECEAIVRGALV